MEQIPQVVINLNPQLVELLEIRLGQRKRLTPLTLRTHRLEHQVFASLELLQLVRNHLAGTTRLIQKTKRNLDLLLLIRTRRIIQRLLKYRDLILPKLHHRVHTSRHELRPKTFQRLARHVTRPRQLRRPITANSVVLHVLQRLPPRVQSRITRHLRIRLSPLQSLNRLRNGRVERNRHSLLLAPTQRVKLLVTHRRRIRLQLPQRVLGVSPPILKRPSRRETIDHPS